ncbi:MAG TPA: ABC transporter ATP-binding protein [Ramlibacter sp.]|nr:ABC transporter ATP-binding protein [Ramlibacter sp.]
MGRVQVEGLGKAYRHYPTRWSRVAEWFVPFGRARHQLKWVLRDVTFSVEPGRAVGIIGVNGAGKSTLLKMITGTTQPTAGRVELSGRVAALLELGLGFHPDFTGRQNAVMSAQLLGLSAQDIERLMPEIEAFAEIGEYMDEPVRVYSSGMQMRLAFSVATALRPDVLIVDEALSVGDTYFQHKSFARIRAFREAGTTLLFVSHDKGAIQALCDEAILLHEGTMAMQGEPEAVMDYYNALIAEKENSKVQQLAAGDGRTRTISGNGEVTLQKIALVDDRSQRVESVEVGQAVTFAVDAQVNAAIDTLVVGIMIKDRLGQPVFGTNTYHMKRVEGPFSPGDVVSYRFGFPANFGEGSYSVAVAAHDGESHITRNYEWRDLALVFKVVNAAHPTFVGTSWVPTTLDIQVTSQRRETARQA